MTKLDVFKCSLNSALDRNYFLDRWISDQSLVTILSQNYQLDFINKGYVNKYIQIVYLTDYQRYDHSVHRLKNEKSEIIHKTSFYYFTKKSDIPKYFATKNEWQHIYNTFRVLRCSNQQLARTTNTKKGELQ